jgi:hypothetical protein
MIDLSFKAFIGGSRSEFPIGSKGRISMKGGLNRLNDKLFFNS